MKVPNLCSLLYYQETCHFVFSFLESNYFKAFIFRFPKSICKPQLGSSGGQERRSGLHFLFMVNTTRTLFHVNQTCMRCLWPPPRAKHNVAGFTWLACNWKREGEKELSGKGCPLSGFFGIEMSLPWELVHESKESQKMNPYSLANYDKT